MVPSMVYKIQMETDFDKIFAFLNLVTDNLLYRNWNFPNALNQIYMDTYSA